MPFGPLIVKPGTSKERKTGSWRTGRTPRFLHEKCIGCGLCVLVCPEACITGDEKNTYKADLDYCKGCSLCAIVCPVKDIEIEEEK